MDKMTPEQRHRCMSRIRSKNTGPEMVVRRWLWKQGFRYRLHVKRLPGSPDIVLHRYHTVININGCFWHGHEGCRLYTVPKSNTPFWQEKVARNRARDAENLEKLKKMGWYNIILWECELKKDCQQETLMRLSRTLSQILLQVNGAKLYSIEEETSMPMAAEDEVPYGDTKQ